MPEYQPTDANDHMVAEADTRRHFAWRYVHSGCPICREYLEHLREQLGPDDRRDLPA